VIADGGGLIVTESEVQQPRTGDRTASAADETLGVLNAVCERSMIACPLKDLPEGFVLALLRVEAGFVRGSHRPPQHVCKRFMSSSSMSIMPWSSGRSSPRLRRDTLAFPSDRSGVLAVDAIVELAFALQEF